MKIALPLDWAVLVGALAVAACHPAGVPLEVRATKREPQAARSVARSVASSAPTLPLLEDVLCPPVDFAALEPKPKAPDARVVALSDVFPREEPRVSGVSSVRIDLGRVQFMRNPGSGDPSSSGVGMGWRGLEVEWLGGEVGSDVSKGLDAWSSARVELIEQQRRVFLLGQRVNLLHAVLVDDGGVDFQCATKAHDEATLRAREADVTTSERANRLIALLESAPARTAAEKVLLGYLLAERGPRDPKSNPGAFDRPLALFTDVAEDPKARRELRARASELIARTEMGLNDSARGMSALKRVLTLTKDRELKIDTLVKLAALSRGDAQSREKLLGQVLSELDHGVGGYRVAETLAELAELRLQRGAFEAARDAASRCAREVLKDDFREPDPWSCATTLAEALAELGGAERGADVPLTFLGPLSLRVMEASLARLDRNEATRAGELLLTRLPEAKEGPQVLDLLASIARDPEKRAALLARRASDYGPRSAWFAEQRVRLAPDDDPTALEQALAQLLEPPFRLGTAQPTADEAILAERRSRLDMVIGACSAELATAPREISLSIDTTRAIPAATTGGANATIAACLTRAAASRFRSVGPAIISAKLVAE